MTVPTFDPLVAPHSLEAEQAVLGAVLLAGNVVLPRIVGDVGLRPHHFYRERHRLTFAAMLAVHDRGDGVDVLTVTEELRRRGQLDDAGGQAAIDSLGATVPNAANVRAYAQTVADEAAWRTRLDATFGMQIAIRERNLDEFVLAEAQLSQPLEDARRTFTPHELGDMAIERLEGGEQTETFPWPFRRLNALSGGMARGQVTLIVGPTSHGKSILADMALESAGVMQTCNAHLFLNEMSVEERTARTLARLSGVPFGSIFSNRLGDDDRHKVLKQVGRVRFGMTQAAGWTARDICREARRGSYDLVAIDLVNKLPFARDLRVQDLADASVEFNALAKTTGCHVLVVAHANRSRADHFGRRPNPTLSDVKDCAQLADDADNVLFVWREQDEDTADPLPDGIIRFGKGRGFGTGGLEVTLNGPQMLFEPRSRGDGEAA